MPSAAAVRLYSRLGGHGDLLEACGYSGKPKTGCSFKVGSPSLDTLTQSRQNTKIDLAKTEREFEAETL